MTCPSSSSQTTSAEAISPVFEAAYHAVIAPDVGDVLCLCDTTLFGLLTQLLERAEVAQQLFVFGPEGARYPVLASGHLLTPLGLFPLRKVAEISEEVDAAGFMPGAIAFTPAPAGTQVPPQDGAEIAEGDEGDEDFPSF